ncbi:MAG: YdbL family protein [Candidatus Omnitrophica bacterium]|nr:YdbL family protein [Candidatus Omnitrophota bacterium]
MGRFSMAWCVAACLVATIVFAQSSYDIKTMTPAVKAALESRKGRFADLKELKAQGIVGETNRGYVQALSGGADVKALVAAENKDRKFVYEAIVEQNGLDASAIATVEKVFGKVQRDKADHGEKVQDENGNWN